MGSVTPAICSLGFTGSRIDRRPFLLRAGHGVKVPRPFLNTGLPQGDWLATGRGPEFFRWVFGNRPASIPLVGGVGKAEGICGKRHLGQGNKKVFSRKKGTIYY